MSASLKDYLHLHFIVWIWGFTAILGLLITIPAVEIVFFRTLIAFLFLGVVLFIRKKIPRISFHLILQMILTGMLIAAHWILFFASARVSTASVCLAGIATCSFWTSLLEPLLFNRSIRWYEIFLGLIVVIGLYVIFHFEFEHALGLSMAVLSAIIAALFTVINAKITHRHSHHVITFYEMIGAWLFTVLFLPIYSMYFTSGKIDLSPTWADFGYLAILAIICTVYAYSVSVEMMKRISAFTINLTVNMEPVYGIILAVIFFGENEKMGAGFYLGTLIILSAVLSYPLLNRIMKRRALKVDNLR
jgi:drug/metabolite transporter (DMT)-like permease